MDEKHLELNLAITIWIKVDSQIKRVDDYHPKTLNKVKPKQGNCIKTHL